MTDTAIVGTTRIHGSIRDIMNNIGMGRSTAVATSGTVTVVVNHAVIGVMSAVRSFVNMTGLAVATDTEALTTSNADQGAGCCVMADVTCVMNLAIHRINQRQRITVATIARSRAGSPDSTRRGYNTGVIWRWCMDRVPG